MSTILTKHEDLLHWKQQNVYLTILPGSNLYLSSYLRGRFFPTKKHFRQNLLSFLFRLLESDSFFQFPPKKTQ